MIDFFDQLAHIGINELRLFVLTLIVWSLLLFLVFAIINFYKSKNNKK